MTTRIDFANLDPSSMEDWAAALGSLLNDAAQSLRSGDAAGRSASMEGLSAFIRFNGFKTLDDIAEATVVDLIGSSVDAALSAIGQRTAVVAGLTKDIQRVAAGARKDAASIRLEAVSRVLDASTESIKAFTSLRDALKSDAGAADLVVKLDDVVRKTQALRNELERR